MYPVTTPYGQVPGYPLNNGFHNGIDYGYPMDTPVIVNGMQIALSNNTGASTGPHLHVGKYVDGVVQDPGVGNGFEFDSAVVYDTGYDTTNGNYVRIIGDGAVWNYLHLQKGSIQVSKGQELKGSEDEMVTKEQLDALWPLITYDGHGPTQPDYDVWVGQKDVNTLIMYKIVPELKDHATVNGGDLVNYFRKFVGHDPTPDDIKVWEGVAHKNIVYNKLMKY